MKRIVLQLLTLVVLFFSIWFGLSRINWVSVFKVEQVSKSLEEKVGDLLWKLFSETEHEIHSTTVKNSLDTLIGHLCTKNQIDKSKIKIHVLKSKEINAFAMPDNYLIIYSGLIDACENEAELLGVLGHEIAHMQKKHVMKRMIKEIGLSVLISMTSGSGGEGVKRAAKLLSSTAYDRGLEKEADITAVDYLLTAGIDPEPFAYFLYRISDEEKNIPSQVYWISTHPDSKERAKYIIEYSKDRVTEKKTILSDENWKKMKDKLND